MIITNKNLIKIIKNLESNEGDLKRFGNFMHDYSLDRRTFGFKKLNPIECKTGKPKKEMGLAWLGRTYGFGIDSNANLLMNEFLFMKQEIERLKKIKK